jgi:hypothetical protein
MNTHFVSYKKCETCGQTRVEQHPIPHCPRCERGPYEAAFATLRMHMGYTHLLGVDPYSDRIYVWTNGVVAAIEGRVDRVLRISKTDEMVARIMDLEKENKDVLAENARLRRRLEAK